MMEIEVHMGDMVALEGPHSLTSTGIGSCLVVTLYDPIRKIGALAHAMLPSRPTRRDGDRMCRRDPASGPSTPDAADPNPARSKGAQYVDVAIDEMVRAMQCRGAGAEDLQAKLIGGANMFPEIDSDLGDGNVASATRELHERGIRVVGMCVGGSQGRSVEFSLATGIVTVRTKF